MSFLIANLISFLSESTNYTGGLDEVATNDRGVMSICLHMVYTHLPRHLHLHLHTHTHTLIII